MDLKVAGMNGIGTVITVKLCGMLSHVWILRGLLIQHYIILYDKNQCKMVAIGAVSFSPVTGCISKSPSQSAQQQIHNSGGISD